LAETVEYRIDGPIPVVREADVVAAGMSAALAAARGCRPADLDGVEVRRQLVAQGARL
jgi:hypothetical protein